MTESGIRPHRRPYSDLKNEAVARRGIGRRILQHAEEQAAAEGFQSLRLVAMRSAGSIYEAAGYRRVADSPITLEDGVILECKLMEKSIDGSNPPGRA